MVVHVCLSIAGFSDKKPSFWLQPCAQISPNALHGPVNHQRRLSKSGPVFLFQEHMMVLMEALAEMRVRWAWIDTSSACPALHLTCIIVANHRQGTHQKKESIVQLRRIQPSTNYNCASTT